MTSHEASNRPTHSEPTSEPPYQGRPGQTRTELVHYSCGCGALFSLAAVRVVNVMTDRDLAEAAVAGGLNRGQCPLCGAAATLFLPYVLHHPEEERFVLVVPESLRHRELELRAELLHDLANATDVAVPAYVKSHDVVFGVEGLRQSLSRPASHVALREELAAKQAHIEERQRAQSEAERLLLVREQQLAKRERAIEDQEESVTMREERLKDRGEEITRVEDELRQRQAEQDAAVERIEGRLRLVEQREATALERDRALAARTRTLQEWEARLRGADAPRGAPASGEAAETVVSPPPTATTEVPAAKTSEEELSTQTRRGRGRGRGPGAPEETQRSATMSEAEASRVVAAADEAEELSDADLLEEEELSVEDIIETRDAVSADAREPAAGDSKAKPAEKAASGAEGAALAAASEQAGRAQPAKPEPPPHWVRSGEGTLHLIDGGEVCLLARLDAASAEAVRRGSADLWVQLHLTPEYPLIALTLVLDPSAEDSRAIHWMLDIEEDTDRAVLQALRRRFNARVLVYDSAYSFIEEISFSPSREVNVAQVVERATQELGTIPPSKASPVQARSRFKGDFDRLGKKRHPFTEDAYSALKSPGEAKLALGILSYWSEPDNHDYLVLVKSVPVDLLDTITGRILGGALAHGLWLPRALKERAVALGLAADLQGLVSRSIEAFGALGSSPAGLEPAQVAENWRRLIADADDLDVPVPRETLRAAEQIIETASASDEGDEGEAEPDDPGPLDKLADEALIRLLERRVTRKEVALELARRNKVEHLEVLFRAARKMGRADLAQLIPSLLAYGEAAGDYFVEGLASRKSFTRQACAIALGELRLRRAVVPLVHQMLSEKTQVWTEIARALGRYGPGAVKPLQRYLRDPKGREDRLVLAMAFLAVNGAAKQIETLRAGTDADVAALAAQALETREAARIVEEQVDGKRATEEHPAMLRFSRRLYRAIAGEEVGQEEREEMDDQDLAEAEGAEDEASLSTK